MADNSKIDLSGLAALAAQKRRAQGDQTGNDPSLPSSVDPNVLDQLQHEADLEAKFGNNKLEAFAGSAAAAATLGISDQLLRATGVSPERLAETRERNPISAGAGTVTGIVAPLVVSGGTEGLLAGAAELTPVAATVKAGKAAEDVVSHVLRNRVRSEAAKQIISKTAGGAVEGAAFGTGNLIDENALGKADLSGQNFVASAGSGALLGGIGGAILGTAQAGIPIVAKKLKPLSDKIIETAKGWSDPEAAMAELSGLTLKQKSSVLKRNPSFFSDAIDYANNELEHSITSTPKSMLQANEAAMARNGRLIGDTIKQLDDALEVHPSPVLSREQISGRLHNVLKSEREALAGVSEVSGEKLAIIDDFDKLIERFKGSQDKLRLSEVDVLRKDLAKLKWKNLGSEVSNNKAEIANALRGELRNVVDEVAKETAAHGIGTPLEALGQQLQKANRAYSIGAELQKGLERRALTGGTTAMPKLSDAVLGAAGYNVFGPTGMVAAAGRKILNSDMRRNFTIMTDLQRQQNATIKLINESVANFMTKSRKPVSSLSMKALTSSGYAIDDSTKTVPKNRQQAFQNISQNLMNLRADPDALTDRLARSTARIASVAPTVAQEAQQTLVRATEFLASKLPQPINSGSELMFPKAYHPSSLELAKFERYVQAVEHPLSVMDDLEKGTLTSEHIEAIKVVYPALYTQLQQEVIRQVASPEGQKMPYGKKVQLGILLDTATDESLTPHAIEFLQSNFAPIQQEGTSAGSSDGTVSASRADKLNSADRAQTTTQAVATRA